jgi:hypothetical protein
VGHGARVANGDTAKAVRIHQYATEKDDHRSHPRKTLLSITIAIGDPPTNELIGLHEPLGPRKMRNHDQNYAQHHFEAVAFVQG